MCKDIIYKVEFNQLKWLAEFMVTESQQPYDMITDMPYGDDLGIWVLPMLSVLWFI